MTSPGHINKPAQAPLLPFGIRCKAEQKYRVWSNEHNAWWRANRAGYSAFVIDAGQYSLLDALQICIDAAHGGLIRGKFPEVMVPVDPFNPHPKDR